ncbi:hypothetical protein CHUAL_005173 [Chamberlinius hualienensis]
MQFLLRIRTFTDTETKNRFCNTCTCFLKVNQNSLPATLLIFDALLQMVRIAVVLHHLVMVKFSDVQCKICLHFTVFSRILHWRQMLFKFSSNEGLLRKTSSNATFLKLVVKQAAGGFLLIKNQASMSPFCLSTN